MEGLIKSRFKKFKTHVIDWKDFIINPDEGSYSFLERTGEGTIEELIIRLYANRLASPTDLQSLKDPKTQLQELLQSRRFSLPDYQVINISGQAHAQVFHVRCSIKKMHIEVSGKGKSRRKAEQMAAEKAIVEVEANFRGKK